MLISPILCAIIFQQKYLSTRNSGGTTIKNSKRLKSVPILWLQHTSPKYIGATQYSVLVYLNLRSYLKKRHIKYLPPILCIGILLRIQTKFHKFATQCRVGVLSSRSAILCFLIHQFLAVVECMLGCKKVARIEQDLKTVSEYPLVNSCQIASYFWYIQACKKKSTSYYTVYQNILFTYQ